MNYLIGLLAFSLSLPVCAQKIKPRQASQSAPRPAATLAATEPVLIVKRTPCHGTCPIYTAAVYADGRVEYEGERFVALLGQHTLRLPVATVNQLLAEAKRVKFTEFLNEYKGQTTDLPATIITVHPVGQPAKTVHAQEKIPTSLEGYITFVNQRLDPLANNVQDK